MAPANSAESAHAFYELGAIHLAGRGGNQLQRVPRIPNSPIGNLSSLAWLHVIQLTDTARTLCPSCRLRAGWGFSYQITRFGSPVFETARAIHALA